MRAGMTGQESRAPAPSGALCSGEARNNVIVKLELRAAHFPPPWIDLPAGDGNVKEAGGVSC